MIIDIDRWEEILVTITRNKTRSLLTAFGIFWGIFMLVALMGGSQGLKALMSKQFEGFASNSGAVAANLTSQPYKGFRKGRYWSMNLDDVERIRRGVPEIDIVTPCNAKWGMSAIYQENKESCTLKGIYPENGKIEEPDMRYGRYINDIDVKESRKVCVIGKRIWEALFPDGSDPCGKYIRVSGIYYRIVGVDVSSGNMSIQGYAPRSVQIPFSTMMQNYNIGNDVQVITYTARAGHAISEVEKKVAALLKQAHTIHPDDTQAVMTVNVEALFSMVDNLFKGINLLSLLVGLGTLLAGAIGVSNIMMVTVKERTVEIGIRRAIGAKPRNILMQILSESIVLTILAGMTGICFAVGVLQLTEMGTGKPFQISFWGAIAACLIVTALGMLAGLAPAYRAMAIKPIEAIREE